MHLRDLGRHVVVHAPAKLNLFFEVLDRRSDGFHEVETVVYPIGLCDTVFLRKRADDRVAFRVIRVGEGATVGDASLGDVPADSSNLVVRAIELLREASGVELGADVVLIKRIPSEAGLGGGSSDAAAGLGAANAAWGLGYSPERLADLGSRLGSDIPLFFRSGASVCRGRGEIVEAAPRSPVLHFVVLRPPIGLRTADVYGACEIVEDRRSLQPFLGALSSADLGAIGRLFHNRLEPAASRLTPWIDRVRDVFGKLDCAGHAMTGSGTCYFGLCRHARHARRVARRLRSFGLGQAYAVRGCR